MTTTQARQAGAAPLTRPPDDLAHPFFARVYPDWAVQADRRGQAEHRAELLAGTSGRVVEVGAGTGLTFCHYPASVTELIAVEPEPTLRRLAEAETTKIPWPYG